MPTPGELTGRFMRSFNVRDRDALRSLLPLGAREATIRLTGAAVAYGFAAAIPDRLDVTVGNGRGERDSPSRTQRPGPFLLINRTKPREAASGERSA